MRNKNVVVGVAAGAALLSAALYLSKNNRLNWKGVCDTAGELVDGIKTKLSSHTGTEGVSDHGGQHLADKARQRAQQNFGRA